MPLFYISIPKQPDVDHIIQITEFMGTKVSFEVYRGKKGSLQCHNCQGYFLSVRACNLQSRCLKCVGHYKIWDCAKAFDTPCRCLHCGDEIPEMSEVPRNKPPKQGKNLKTKSKNNVMFMFQLPTVHSLIGRLTNPNLTWEMQTDIKLHPPTLKIQLSRPNSKFECFFGHRLHKKLLEFQKLPELRLVSTEIDRIHILFTNILSLSKSG